MYQSIEELPYNVRQALGDGLSESWMNHYNNAIQGIGEVQLARLMAWQNIRAETDDVRWFETYATCQIKDAHGEILDVESIAKCMPAYINGGGELAVSHRAGTYGTIYDYQVREHPLHGVPAIYVHGAIYRGRPSWDRLWSILLEKKQGDKIPLAVSIGGSMKAGLEWICDQGGECENRVVTTDLREISVTYSPANPAAVGHANALAKHMEDTTMTEEHEKVKEEASSSADLEEVVKALADKVGVLESGYNDVQKALSDLATAIEGMMKATEPKPEDEEEKKEPEPEEEEDKSKALEERLKALEEKADLYTKAMEKEADTPAPEARLPSYDKERPAYDGTLAAKTLYGRK